MTLFSTTSTGPEPETLAIRIGRARGLVEDAQRFARLAETTETVDLPQKSGQAITVSTKNAALVRLLGAREQIDLAIKELAR